jgi:hypothetical protein
MVSRCCWEAGTLLLLAADYSLSCCAAGVPVHLGSERIEHKRAHAFLGQHERQVNVHNAQPSKRVTWQLCVYCRGLGATPTALGWCVDF